jgi:NAD(P)-dependent dehydrogenase (short-subunit alcohol dehydrogenase family)
MTATTSMAGRVALVTGGGRGLGRAVACRLAEEGIAVAVCGRSMAPLGETAGMIRHAGGVCEAFECDVADSRSVDAMREQVLRWNAKVDILINNAGIAGPTANLVDIEPGDWDDVMAVNLRGAFLCCRAFLPGMLSRHAGDIINVASVSGKRPLARRTPYCASKMALIGLTRTLAFEVAAAGVRVNSISPGPVRGDRMEGVFARDARLLGSTVEEAEKAFTSRAAMQRLVEEAEVAEGVLALLRLSGLTAADLDLSGGMVA